MSNYGNFDTRNPDFARNSFDADLLDKRRNRRGKKGRQWSSGDTSTLIIVAVIFFALIISDMIR